MTTPEEMFGATVSGNARTAKLVLDAYLERDGNVPAQIVGMLADGDPELHDELDSHYAEWFKTRGEPAPKSYSGDPYE